MGFYELLIVSALGIFLTAIAMLKWTERAGCIGRRAGYSDRSWSASCLYGIVAVGFVIASINSMIVGTRSILYYVFFAITASFSLYFVDSTSNKQRSLSIFVVMLLVIVQVSIPMAQNRGIVYGPDQWRDLAITKQIAETGKLDYGGAGEHGEVHSYYAIIPLFNILNAVISEVVGCQEMFIFAMLPVVFGLLSVLSIYLIMGRLTEDRRVSLIAVLLPVSMPRMGTGQAIPASASLSLGILLVLMFVYQLKPRKRDAFGRKYVILMVPIALAATIYHPSGILLVLLLSSAVALVNYLFPSQKLSRSEISCTHVTIITSLLISVAYWSSDPKIFQSILARAVRTLNALVSLRQIPSTYEIQYQATGLEIFAFAWALPVAFSAAYVLMSLLESKQSISMENPLSKHFFFSAGCLGLLLVLFAFGSIYLDPGSRANERYLDALAFPLLLFSSAFVFGRAFQARKKFVVMFGVAILLTQLMIGLSLPDHSPFEHPTFGAIRYSYTSLTEAQTIVLMLPNDSRVYNDHDIPIGGAADIAQRIIKLDVSYQNTRPIIDEFKKNIFNSTDAQYTRAIIIIIVEEITEPALFSNRINVLYCSGRHVVLSVT